MTAKALEYGFLAAQIFCGARFLRLPKGNKARIHWWCAMAVCCLMVMTEPWK